MTFRMMVKFDRYDNPACIIITMFRYQDYEYIYIYVFFIVV